MKERFNPDYGFEDFNRDFKDWYFDYIYREQCIGAVISRNGFIHIGKLPEYRKRWASKNEIIYLIKRAMKDGKARTTIFRDDKFRKDFAERIGFKMIDDNEIQTYEVDYENIWK